jgi:DNA invertase Pin-like site-specific DNA recombinase
MREGIVPVQRLRCAVYTRKSSEEGLDMAFNSLDAQREACHAYIVSQKPEGWIPVRDDYDDGGFSGGNLDRPGLRRLMKDIEDGLVDVVVVYKIDRLSRSLMDFSKLVDVFDKHGVTFVSVTQSFNTTTSMGRLTLNILLSFAQFEREVIGERVRDKVAASRKKGMWMGGHVPFGYKVENRKLIIDKDEAAIVRTIFEGFLKLGSATLLAQDLQQQDIRTRSGKPIDKGWLYKLFATGSTLAKPSTRALLTQASTSSSSPKTSGTGCMASWPRAPEHGPARPEPDPCSAEGPAVRTQRHGHDSDPHQTPGQAVPILCHHLGSKAWTRHLPGTAYCR